MGLDYFETTELLTVDVDEVDGYRCIMTQVYERATDEGLLRVVILQKGNVLDAYTLEFKSQGRLTAQWAINELIHWREHRFDD